MIRLIISMLTCLLISQHSNSQVIYPAESKFINLVIEGRGVRMSYMDILPANRVSKQTILLLHGKNFNGYYWKELLPYFLKAGYRVIIPDQVGWGKSDRPSNIQYSFHLLANNTKLLLDSLGVKRTVVLGHSMGGMLAARFSLMFPGMVEKLVLENPIGLEDYKTFVSYTPVDSLYAKEKSATYASYKKYQTSYYPEWKPEYEQYVAAQAADLTSPGFDSICWTNAHTYQMIYEQPVIYEFGNLTIPVCLVIGLEDRTVVGKDKLTPQQKGRFGNYPLLGREAAAKIPNAVLKELSGVGHIPHIQSTQAFWNAISGWLNGK